MHRETRDGDEVIVCTVGKTVLLYDARRSAGLRSSTTPAATGCACADRLGAPSDGRYVLEPLDARPFGR